MLTLFVRVLILVQRQREEEFKETEEMMLRAVARAERREQGGESEGELEFEGEEEGEDAPESEYL